MSSETFHYYIYILFSFYLVWKFSGDFIPQAGDREKPINCSHNREFSRKFGSFGRSAIKMNLLDNAILLCSRQLKDTNSTYHIDFSLQD